MDKNYIENQIIDMYCKGYSIKNITDYVFRYSNRNVPKNNCFRNFYVVHKKEYSRLNCDNYVSRVILNYNCNRKYIV